MKNENTTLPELTNGGTSATPVQTTPSGLKAIIAGAVLGTITVSTVAHEEPFGYVRGAQTEPKGELEVVQWTTARVGKVGGRYLGLDLATEIEYGITDRLQGALYILNDYHYLRNASGSSEVFDDVNRFSFNGVSAELKYQLLNPYKDAFGFAVYFEPGFKRISGVSGEREDEFELETKLILQKNFLDHRLITALNYTIEPEFEREPGESWETGLRMEGALGASYKMAGNWWIGAEARLDTEFEDADLNESEFVRLGIGPTIHYSGDKFFATLAVMPQVWGWPDRTGTGGMHLDEGERLEVRFKIGAEF